MHFYYLDEAGCTGEYLNNNQQPVFVLGGVSVRDEGWNRTQEDFATILSRYFSGNIQTTLNFMPSNYFHPMVLAHFRIMTESGETS